MLAGIKGVRFRRNFDLDEGIFLALVLDGLKKPA
jgi:hypothetical protein